MRPTKRGKSGSPRQFLWDLLTFDRLMTGPVVHLTYWAGLGFIALVGFFITGASIGMALKERNLMGVLLAFPVLVSGVLVVAVLTLLWRSFCEFYVAVFRISEDLRALRQSSDADLAERGRPRSDSTGV